MTDTIDATTSGDELVDELRSWLEDNWDPDLTVAEWWERLGLAGWAAPTLPFTAFGRGLARSLAVQVQNEIADFGALGAPAGLGGATPGTVVGNLDRRAGDFAPKARPARAARPVRAEGATEAAARPTKKDRTGGGMASLLIGLAKGNGTSTDPVVRQALARLVTLGEIGRYNNERLKAVRAGGGDIAGMGNISKLSMSNIVRLQRDLGLAIVGAQGMLHAYQPGSQKVLDEATGNPFLTAVTTTALYAQAPPIYGGTDQIQRNIIGERVLGLPKEPGPAKDVPFSDLPRNA